MTTDKRKRVKRHFLLALVSATMVMSPASAQSNIGSDVSRERARQVLNQLRAESMPEEATKIKIARPPPGVQSDVFSVFPLTFGDNPLIREECRVAAIQERLDAVPPDMRDNKMIPHIQEQGEKWHAHLADGPYISYQQYLDHAHDCEVCGPIVTNILQCHVDAVAERPNKTVFFAVGETTLDSRDRARLAEFINKAGSKNILIESRASFLNPDEKISVNDQICRRRGQAVERFLEQNGIPSSRIKVKHVTWTPPRLQDQITARAYGISSDLSAMPDPRWVNQSVTVTAY